MPSHRGNRRRTVIALTIASVLTLVVVPYGAADKPDAGPKVLKPPGHGNKNVTFEVLAPFESASNYESDPCGWRCDGSVLDATTGLVSIHTLTPNHVSPTTGSLSSSNSAWSYGTMSATVAVPYYADSILVEARLHVERAEASIDDGSPTGESFLTWGLFTQHNECWNQCGGPESHALVVSHNCGVCKDASTVLEDQVLLLALTLRSQDGGPIPPGDVFMDAVFESYVRGGEVDTPITNVPTLQNARLNFDGELVSFRVEVDPAVWPAR